MLNFSAAEYIRSGHDSSELRQELNAMEVEELKKVYKQLTSLKLKAKTANNKELLVNEIVERTLDVVNFGWVFKYDKPLYS